MTLKRAIQRVVETGANDIYYDFDLFSGDEGDVDVWRKQVEDHREALADLQALLETPRAYIDDTVVALLGTMGYEVRQDLHFSRDEDGWIDFDSYGDDFEHPQFGFGCFVKTLTYVVETQEWYGSLHFSSNHSQYSEVEWTSQRSKDPSDTIQWLNTEYARLLADSAEDQS